jgi:hypothetical protein
MESAMSFKDGDLVIVYRASHKCGEKLIGRIFTYEAKSPVGITCNKCHTENIAKPGEPISAGSRPGVCIPASWLKKLGGLHEEEKAKDAQTA